MIHMVRPDEGMAGGFRYLATGEHTRGAYFALELEGPPGRAGVGHSHDFEDEAEYVATGAREIHVDDTLLRAPAGSFVLVPRGSLHDMWTVGSGPSRYLHLFSPAGIENWFFERARLQASGATADELSAARTRHGVRGERTSAPSVLPYAVLSRDAAEDPLVVRGGDTNGAYAILGFTSVAGGPPVRPHVHRNEEEAFYVADGEMTITLAGETHAAPAGTFVLVPRGTVHSYAHRGDGPARVLLIVSPPGFERHFEESPALRSAFLARPAPEAESEVEAASERAGLRWAD